MTRKNKRKSLKQTAEALARIAEGHLAGMPEDEREERVAAVNRRTFTPCRDTRSTASKTERTPVYPVLARDRE
jgi:hypothetical protein